ncbi:Rieske (2Fe-2S) protein [Streptomyces sp. NPDC048349]|uniref:Rieske (2Fe-2S) protein n=1 Tax=Streptomyces sp. NPDC048349 TaxID=3155486 RepID=UPI00341DD19A
MEASRRVVLNSAAAAGLAMAASAGVGSRGAEAATRDDGRAGPAEERGAPLAGTKDIPIGGGVIFSRQNVVVTQPAEGTFKAFSSICTHQGCTLSSVSGGTARCPCHGSAFRVTDGSVARGPAPSPLAPRTIRITGGQIYLV